MIGPDPMMAASVSADVPSWFFSFTSAPALISARTSSRSPLLDAHMIAVVPSGPGVFGFVPFESSCNTAARSFRSAASRRGFPAAEAIETETTSPAIASHARISDLRQDSTAVSDLLHRDVIAIEQRDQQIRKARVLRVLHVLAAFDPAVRVAEDRRRQRIVVVLVAVAHVAAEEDRRVIEHCAGALLRLRQTIDELGEHLGVITLDLHQLVLLRRLVAVMRQRVERL